MKIKPFKYLEEYRKRLVFQEKKFKEYLRPKNTIHVGNSNKLLNLFKIIGEIIIGLNLKIKKPQKKMKLNNSSNIILMENTKN